MTNITTNKDYNFDKAESDMFAWDYWDGTNGSMLTHKPSGRQIYQMHWLNEQGKMSERVDEATAAAAKDFRAALKVLQNQKPLQKEAVFVAEPEHGVNGYCRHCGTYCYGDCRAS